MATRKPKLAQSSVNHPIDPKKHRDVNKGTKIYNKGKETDNPYEREMFLKRSGPQLPLAKAAKKSPKGRSKTA